MLESRVENHLVAVVEWLGGECPKVRYLGKNGCPDRLILLPGGVLHFGEAKRPGKDLQPHQQREFKRLRDLGFSAVKFDSIEFVNQFFKV